MADLVERLREAITARKELAEAATPGPWEHVDYFGSPHPDTTFMGCGSVITMGEDVMGGNIAAPSGDLYPRGGYSPKEDMAFIAANDPAAVLRGVAEDLAILERHAGDFPYDPENGPGDYSWTETCMKCHVPTPCPEVLSVARRHGLDVTEPDRRDTA